MMKEYKRLKWFFLWVLFMAVGMLYSNFTGYRILSFGGQQKWSAGGAGLYHK